MVLNLMPPPREAALRCLGTPSLAHSRASVNGDCYHCYCSRDTAYMITKTRTHPSVVEHWPRMHEALGSLISNIR